MSVQDRLVLSDAQWERMAPLIIGRPDQRGSTGRDNRMFVEGVLWIVRTGSPWRDLPDAFGEWNSVFHRFSRWSQKGVWWRIFEAMSDDPDFEYRSWIPPSSVPTNMRRARIKGVWRSALVRAALDQALGRLILSLSKGARRFEHEDPHGGAWARLPGALCPHTGPEG